jgi:hypothetical protein
VLLESRGLVVTADERTRILECADIAKLDAWIRKAVSITKVAELF